jgi:hypothetical protein
VQDEDGSTPLHLAVSIHGGGATSLELARLLVGEGGAGVNVE